MRTLLFVLALQMAGRPVVGQSVSCKKVLRLMGSRFELVAVCQDTSSGNRAIREAIAEIKRIEREISSWDPASQTSKVNAMAGTAPVKVTAELLNLTARAIKISELTQGAFDISFQSIDRLWTFDGHTMEPPDSALVAASVSKINYKNIVIDREKSTIYLKEKGMKIGFGAMGKGYAANRAAALMQQMDIAGGLVNAGGDLMAWGVDEQGAPWKIGVADPNKKEQYIAWLQAKDMSVVTSGNYEKFVIIRGKRYSHIIDPHTGYPARGIKSVTIVSPDAELSDALATSVFVLGTKRGIALIDTLKNVECLIVDDHNKMITSKQLRLNYY